MNTVVPCFAENEVHTPQIIETVYPTDEVVVADIVINADSSGESDVTAIIQQAIDNCAANGGGTVWLPAGRYRVTGNIYIRQFVTLMGDYQDPDVGDDYGTIIIADVKSSDAMNPALFTVGASAGAVGLTVWYPNQSIDNIKPYPFTFYVVGNEDYMLSTIKNCTLINSYRGIGA
ncbi:MAG: coagulation factor 5/8 type domain-containing protein, partial [Clostridia bacterium]|nr:coagulation factor 5/8 type domain-containing protein [Clostridia bacterium]